MTQSYKSLFPIFANSENKDMIYLDSGATTLKPEKVIHAISEYYETYSSNIHRGLYPISIRASEEYEKTRQEITKFINAARSEEIVFVKGATEGLNLLASTITKIIPKGSELLTTIIDHHANFVPWQQIAINEKFKFGVVTFDPRKVTEAELLQNFEDSITKETSVLTMPYVSNVIGVVLPVDKIVKIAKKVNPNILIVLDVCQAVQHLKIDVQSLDVDFVVFSGHKLFGPTGIGVVWGKYQALDKLPPYQYGGDMIEEVMIDKTIFKNPPTKFEAGTPPIAGVIGLKAAIEFVQEFGVDKIHKVSCEMRNMCVDKMRGELAEKIVVYTPKFLESSSILSFNLVGCHPHDVAQLLGDKNICIRVGHHCAQPLHTYLDIPSSCRASFSIYNTNSDIDIFINALSEAHKILS
ncbi:MAG: cysteine desulfurase [Patescibacteria group bacterium]